MCHGRTRCGQTCAAAHMKDSTAAEAWPQPPQTTVDASSPPNSRCTTDRGRSAAAGAFCACSAPLPADSVSSAQAIQVTDAARSPWFHRSRDSGHCGISLVRSVSGLNASVKRCVIALLPAGNSGKHRVHAISHHARLDVIALYTKAAMLR